MKANEVITRLREQQQELRGRRSRPLPVWLRSTGRQHSLFRYGLGGGLCPRSVNPRTAIDPSAADRLPGHTRCSVGPSHAEGVHSPSRRFLSGLPLYRNPHLAAIAQL